MELVGPLSKDYCNLFYIYSMISFVGVIIVVVTLLYMLATTRPKNWGSYSIFLMAGIAYLIAYYRERLLYNMCVRS